MIKKNINFTIPIKKLNLEFMKRILIFLVLTTQSYSQIIKSTYILDHLRSMNLDSNDSTESPIKPETFSFSYSNQKSLYEKIPSQKSSIDTSYIEHNGVKHESYNSVIIANVDITYKDLKNNKIIKEYSVKNKDFSAKDKLIDYEWTKTEETKIISGYNCKKATTKKAFVPTTAWYTEEIPINDGPYDFWGLPGLIIKVELDGYSTITLDKIKISDENFEVKEPKNKSTQFKLNYFYSSIDAYLNTTSVLSKYKYSSYSK